jgi:hypothetical protein
VRPTTVAAAVTSLRRRLKKLEALLTDPSGLVPHSEKWLEYWERWFDKYTSVSTKRVDAA